MPAAAVAAKPVAQTASRAQTVAKEPCAPSRRAALLIGINDYTAAGLPRVGQPAGGRVIPSLRGAVRDVEVMRELLMIVFGFKKCEIVVLTDRQATREAILRELEKLAAAGRDDVRFVYFSGHGSQRRNSLSAEPDRLDETLVPADAAAGASDISDKELRAIFNQLLDRGARLTVILDACHSASGTRGLTTPVPIRGVQSDLRDAADGTAGGPAPEDRGALVIAAAQDSGKAWETVDEKGVYHGAFSRALAGALRDAAGDEPAVDTFLRARARLRAGTPFQDPVIAGTAEVRLRPFLAQGDGTRKSRRTIAIESVEADGKVILQGGWANGLTKGSYLKTSERHPLRLQVEAMLGLGRSRARLVSRSADSSRLKSGGLLEIEGWAAPEGRLLRIWTPQGDPDLDSARALAGALRTKVKWIGDPTVSTPTHVLRWRNGEWELASSGDVVERLGRSPDAGRIVPRIPAEGSLFLQLPAPEKISRALVVGPGSVYGGIIRAETPETADYILVGRVLGGRIEYAWVRPWMTANEQHRTPLPVRTEWTAAAADPSETVLDLRDALLRLGRIHGWLQLESPADAASPYSLAIVRTRDGRRVEGPTLVGGEDYGLVLRSRRTPPPSQVRRRFVYAFTIDSRGRSVLLFPRQGSVENQLPIHPSPAPATVPLGTPALFAVSPPFGSDTYFLLTTEESLPNPWVLEWAGFRELPASPDSLTPLEALLLHAPGELRSVLLPPITSEWSIERYTFASVPPDRRSMAQ